MHQFDVNDITMERNNSEDIKRRMERKLHQRTCTEKAFMAPWSFCSGRVKVRPRRSLIFFDIVPRRGLTRAGAYRMRCMKNFQVKSSLHGTKKVDKNGKIVVAFEEVVCVACEKNCEGNMVIHHLEESCFYFLY